MRLALLSLALLAAGPAAAQTGLVGVTPDEVLAQTWAEALGGADAVAFALGDVADDTTGAPAGTVGEAGRARALAAVAAGATSATLSAALQFSIALADPAEQATVEAALAEDVVGLHTLLLLVAETVDPPPPDPTLQAADPMDADGGPPPMDAGAGLDSWTAIAAQLRALAGRLDGAVTALGLSAP